MFMEWIAKVGLLQLREDKNILKNWPLEVKRNVVSEVVHFQANQYAIAHTTLTTPAHVYWVMECIGACFQLPIENVDVINLAIDVYKKWLFDQKRPAPIHENPQVFYREIFRHFSFLFETRRAVGPVLKDHIYVCNRVLDIFLQLGANGREMLDEESWNELLLIILGITDATLRGKQGLTELNYGLLKVLFQVWLCSQTYNRTMWNHLQSFTIQWGKYICTIKQWNSVCIGLTNRVVRLLYGPTEGTPIAKFHWKGLNAANNPNENVGAEVTELDLPDEYVYYAWQSMIHIIGNPNALLDPETHLEAFQGIAQMTRVLAQVGSVPPELAKGQKKPKLPYAPDGNTILAMFGPWYLEAVNRKVGVFNEGRAVAYAALCRVFCRKGGRPFTTTNLAKFYSALALGLEEDDIIVVSSILLNSRKLFVYELEGSHILIPRYIEVVKKILTVDATQVNPYPDLLRSACITILSSLLCLPTHYDGYTQKLYADLKISLIEILSKAILCEKDQNNLQHLLWCISVFIFEYSDVDLSVAPHFINAILKLVKNASSESTSPHAVFVPEVFQTIFEVLSSLTMLKDQIHEGDKRVIPQLVTELAHFVVLQMNLFRNNKRQPSTVSRLVSESFYCMCDWIMCSYDVIFASKEKIKIVLNAIETGLNADKFTKKIVPELSEIKEAAEYLLCHMLNHVGHFPPTTGLINTSTDLSEDILAADNESPDKSKYVRFFMFDDLYLLSIIEQPDSRGGPGVTVIVRDVTGRYAWDATLLFGEKRESYIPIDENENPFKGATNSGLTGFTAPAPENDTLLKFSVPRPITSRQNTGSSISFIDIIEHHKAEENKILVESTDLRLFPPETPSKYDGDCKFQMSRLLLSHMGFLQNVDLQKRFTQLQCNHKLLRNLKILDMSAQRECNKIGVVYVREGQDQQEEIFKNEGGSESFNQFVEDLGWLVPLDTHTGFMGGLDRKLSTGKVSPYYCNYKTEVMFHVPTLMPTLYSASQSQQVHKKRHVGNDHVNIIWSEHTREYRKDTISSQFNFVQIVIYPLRNGLFRIQIYKKDEQIPTFGPLFDGMVISKRILGRMVRTTAINANRNVRFMQQGYGRPYPTRKKLIQEIAARYKDPMHCSTYLGSLFSTKRISDGKKPAANKTAAASTAAASSGGVTSATYTTTTAQKIRTPFSNKNHK